MKLSGLLGLTMAITTCCAAATLRRYGDLRSPHVRKILEQPRGSWLENIAVRSDGSLLATRLDVPEIYLIDPQSGRSSLLASFPNVTGALGIAEYEPDVFAVAVGNLSLTTLSSTPGSYSVQSIDLNQGEGRVKKVAPKLLAHLGGAENLNGLTFRAPNTLYSSDSFGGRIWSVDTRTGKTDIAVGQDPLLQPTEESFLGVNGLRWDTCSQSLYFTNWAQVILGRVPFNGSGFEPAEKVADGSSLGLTAYDDFALSPYKGSFFATTNRDNSVEFISNNGKEQIIVAGALNSTELAGATSAAFGRTPDTENILYVTTSGGLAGPVNNDTSNGITGAKIVALEFDF